MPATISLSYQTVLQVIVDQICTSDSGNYVLALKNNNVYLSLDGGALWKSIVVSPYNYYYYNYCAISGNGQVFYVSSSSNTLHRGTFVSNRLTWTQLTFSSTINVRGIDGIATDYTGKSFFAIGRFSNFDYYYYSEVYKGLYSSNAGATSSYVVLTNLQNSYDCIALALDSTGTNLMCVYNDYSNLNIATSSNSGTSFTNRFAYSANGYVPNDACFATSTYSANSISYIVPYTGSSVYTTQPWIYKSTSSNSYVSAYNGQSTSMYFQHLATTGNGATSYVGSTYGMYCITDYGTTWALCYDSAVYSIAVSGDGSRLYFATSSGINMYTNVPIVTRNVSTRSISPTRYPTTMSPTVNPVQAPSFKPTNSPFVLSSSPTYVGATITTEVNYVITLNAPGVAVLTILSSETIRQLFEESTCDGLLISPNYCFCDVKNCLSLVATSTATISAVKELEHSDLASDYSITAKVSVAVPLSSYGSNSAKSLFASLQSNWQDNVMTSESNIESGMEAFDPNVYAQTQSSTLLNSFTTVNNDNVSRSRDAIISSSTIALIVLAVISFGLCIVVSVYCGRHCFTGRWNSPIMPGTYALESKVTTSDDDTHRIETGNIEPANTIVESNIASIENGNLSHTLSAVETNASANVVVEDHIDDCNQ